MPPPVIEFRGRHLRILSRGRWEYADRVGSTGVVAIVAVTETNELLLIEQERIPVQSRVLELPAGLVGDVAGEEDEAHSLAAARELEEETGFRADNLIPLTVGPPSAGLSSEIIEFFGAKDAEKIGPGGGDDSEDITVHVVPLTEVAAFARSRAAEGVLVDPKVWTGLYFAEHPELWTEDACIR